MFSQFISNSFSTGNFAIHVTFLFQFILYVVAEFYLLFSIQKLYLTNLLIIMQALIIPLNDGGFLILLHSSHFLTFDGKM